ncbi:hypothetical protein GCM10027516_22990 [Niabella aquatica]
MINIIEIYFIKGIFGRRFVKETAYENMIKTPHDKQLPYFSSCPDKLNKCGAYRCCDILSKMALKDAKVFCK